MPKEDHDWSAYSKLVLNKIDELTEGHRTLSREVTELRIVICGELASLKAKAAIWGGIAGTVVGGILSQIFKHVGKQ